MKIHKENGINYGFPGDPDPGFIARATELLKHADVVLTRKGGASAPDAVNNSYILPFAARRLEWTWVEKGDFLERMVPEWLRIERVIVVSSPRVLMVVPFAALQPDSPRPAQLQQLRDHLKGWLRATGTELVVAEQVGGERFNKGLTFNAAIRYYLDHHGSPDLLLLHDVDILPDEQMLAAYGETWRTPLQLVPKGGDYPDGIPVGGGVTLIRVDHYLQANGFPNSFVGWGGEDNAMMHRLKAAGLKLHWSDAGSIRNLDRETAKKANPERWRLMKQDRVDWRTNGIGQLPPLSVRQEGDRILVSALAPLDQGGSGQGDSQTGLGQGRAKVFYDRKLTWERDFVEVDLLQHKVALVEFVSSADLKEVKGQLVFASFPVRDNKLVLMSDEAGRYASVKAALHQYAHIKTGLQLPLGYVSGYLGGRSSLEVEVPPIEGRALDAAFVGQVNGRPDRQSMLAAFEASDMTTEFVTGQNTWSLETQKVTGPDLFKLYSSATFVPVGRGNIVLDCFRVYEAIVAGAIPVIVGSQAEVEETFSYGGHPLPAIFYRTWTEAAAGCRERLKDLAALQRKQDELRAWWRDRVLEARVALAAEN